MLSDEERRAILTSIDPETKRLPKGFRDFAHAIESAATAPLLARIAELDRSLDVMAKNTEAQAHASLQREIELTEKVEKMTRELAEARKDAMNAAALICDALPAPPSCNVLERNLWDVATVAAADAIRAAIKEQT